MSGTLWALAYDPTARPILAGIPRILGRLGVFGDDLGLWLRIHVGRGAGPSGQGTSESPSTVREEFRLFAMFSDMEVVRHGRYLVFFVGPGAADHAWAATVGKCRNRVRHVAVACPATRWRVLRLVLRFVMRFAIPAQEVFRAEQAAVASLTRSVVHSRGPGLLLALPLLGACRPPPFVQPPRIQAYLTMSTWQSSAHATLRARCSPRVTPAGARVALSPFSVARARRRRSSCSAPPRPAFVVMLSFVVGARPCQLLLSANGRGVSGASRHRQRMAYRAPHRRHAA